jgi:hypothetical protein
MIAGPLTDAGERFPLGIRNGLVHPTCEPVSDTAVTPFGLTLRITPTPRKVVPVRGPDGFAKKDDGTEKVTTMSTDGSDEGDTRADIIGD